jgi:hypothetical protein
MKRTIPASAMRSGNPLGNVQLKNVENAMKIRICLSQCFTTVPFLYDYLHGPPAGRIMYALMT